MRARTGEQARVRWRWMVRTKLRQPCDDSVRVSDKASLAPPADGDQSRPHTAYSLNCVYPRARASDPVCWRDAAKARQRRCQEPKSGSKGLQGAASFSALCIPCRVSLCAQHNWQKLTRKVGKKAPQKTNATRTDFKFKRACVSGIRAPSVDAQKLQCRTSVSKRKGNWSTRCG